MTSKEALSDLKLKQPPATGQEDYRYLSSVWQQGNIRTFKDFLRWYNNRDVVSTLEVMQKMVDVYHNKGTDRLKLGCILPNIANICLLKSTTAKFNPFTESDFDLLEEKHEDMVGGPSIVLTMKAVKDEIFIRNSTDWCQSIVGNDASQLHPFCMCQAMPIGLYT